MPLGHSETAKQPGLSPQNNRKNKKGMRKSINDRVRSKMLGGKCPCCGENERTVIHHILPLVLGGLDEESNLIGICDDCHAKLHGATDVHTLAKMSTFTSGKLGGRPRKTDYEKAFNALDRFAMFEISKEELSEILDIRPSEPLSNHRFFKEWKKDRQIPNGTRIGTSQLYNRYGHSERMENGRPLIIENGKYIGIGEVTESMRARLFL